MAWQEGIIKFRNEFKEGPPLESRTLRELDSWRRILYQTELIGQTPNKYAGAGYGNVSQILKPYDTPVNKRRFIITGSQTSHLSHLTEKHYPIVLEYYFKKNLVVTEGPMVASSESMTHGSIYDLDDSTRFIFHSHSSYIWKSSKKLEIPTTRETIEYGTPEMVEEVQRLFRDTKIKDLHIFSMGGHEDGIFTFGETSEQAGLVMLKYLARSMLLYNFSSNCNP